MPSNELLEMAQRCISLKTFWLSNRALFPQMARILSYLPRIETLELQFIDWGRLELQRLKNLRNFRIIGSSLYAADIVQILQQIPSLVTFEVGSVKSKDNSGIQQMLSSISGHASLQQFKASIIELRQRDGAEEVLSLVLELSERRRLMLHFIKTRPRSWILGDSDLEDSGSKEN